MNNSLNVGPLEGFAPNVVQLFNVSSLDLLAGGGADERTNVAAAHPDVVKELTELLLAFNASAVSSAFQGIPDDPMQDPKLHNGTVVPLVL